jgi:hypothetical protein
MVIMERRFLPNGRKQRFMVIGAETMFSSLPTGRKSKMDRHAVFQHPRPRNSSPFRYPIVTPACGNSPAARARSGAPHPAPISFS